MSAITTYINDAIRELHLIRWPTWQQSVRLSAIVLAFTAVATMVFGGVDYLLSEAVKFLLSFTY